jgi:peptidoglycan/LPS O-acetylase OafA/YrhL
MPPRAIACADASAAVPIPGLRVHVPELDGIRGIAISLVVFYHLYLVGGLGDKGSVYGSVVSFGWSGVDLFFVLSGLLITGILLDSRAEQKYFQKFYARRILRIFPLYYATVVAIFDAGPFLLRRLSRGHLIGYWVHPSSQIFAWTFTLNIPFGLGLNFSPLIHPLWSLAVEEQFYLVWPLAVYLLSPITLRRVCLGLIVAAPIARMSLVSMGRLAAAYSFTPCRLDALAFGALLALTLRTENGVALIRAWAWRVGLASLVGLSAILPFRGTKPLDPVVVTVGLSLVALCYVSVLGGILSTPPGSVMRRPFCLPPLQMLGKYSYAIYVFHQAVIILLVIGGFSATALAARLHARIFGEVAFGSLAVATSLGAAMASWWLIEKRFLALKRAFRY